MESIHDDELVRIALKFLDGISYRGPGTIEFKTDIRDGKYKMIELNARLALHSILPTRAGINFPLIQYLDLTDQSISRTDDYADGVKWLDIVRDFQVFLQLRRKGTLSFSSWVGSLKDIQCHAFYARDDLKPFFKNIEYGGRFARLPIFLLKQR